MSLLGRLEDLSLTDIVQIVYLSRRTGVLEIVDERGRHTVLFNQGLVVNASSLRPTRIPILAHAPRCWRVGLATGAAIGDLTEATGWQGHSVRAALTGLRKEGKELVRVKDQGGVTHYRLAAAA